MSSPYDQQIKQLVDHIQALNQAVHERDRVILQWQQTSRAVQEERARFARQVVDAVKASLARLADRFAGVREENRRLRAYADHQRQLQEVVARDLQGQLRYALARIDELAGERLSWRAELAQARAAAQSFQQQAQEQSGVIGTQQAALSELRGQLEHAQAAFDREDALEAELRHRQLAIEELQTLLHQQDATVAAKERELRSQQDSLDGLRTRAAQELQAMQAQLSAKQSEVLEAKAQAEAMVRAELAARQAAAEASARQQDDERVGELMELLANSEREVSRMYRELAEEQARRKELEYRVEALTKELGSTKRKHAKLVKEADAEKGQRLVEVLRDLDAMRARTAELEAALEAAAADKTAYMQALEGKGKLRALPKKPQEEGGS